MNVVPTLERWAILRCPPGQGRHGAPLTGDKTWGKFRSLEKKDTILLVEDSDNDLVLMRYAFKKAGVSNPIVEMRDGEAAIEYLSGDGVYADRERYPLPCLIITDLKMPRVDGFGVLEWLQARPEFDRVPKLVLTASGIADDHQRAVHLGACAYFVKPNGLEDLVALVKHMDEAWITAHCPLA